MKNLLNTKKDAVASEIKDIHDGIHEMLRIVDAFNDDTQNSKKTEEIVGHVLVFCRQFGDHNELMTMCMENMHRIAADGEVQ